MSNRYSTLQCYDYLVYRQDSREKSSQHTQNDPMAHTTGISQAGLRGVGLWGSCLG